MSKKLGCRNKSEQHCNEPNMPSILSKCSTGNLDLRNAVLTETDDDRNTDMQTKDMYTVMLLNTRSELHSILQQVVTIIKAGK